MVVSLKRWVGKTAIVTGASAGIGAAIVESLVEAGINVVGVARRKEKLQVLAEKVANKKGKFYPFQADLTNEKEILDAFEFTKKNVGPIHILINNAGSMTVAKLTEAETENFKRTLDLNVLSLCIATREAVKDMRANNVNGHIIHINSVVGHYVPRISGFNVYPASKHAVTALTESLRHELNSLNSKIKITSVSPGYVKTEFLDVAGFWESQATKEAFSSAPGLASEDIADAVVYVLATPPHVQVHELIIRPVGETQ